MKRTSTRISRKASTVSKPVNVPAQASAAEDSRADIYQRITDRSAAAIEAGAGKWQMPWHPGADGAAPRLPVNAVTGKPYRGINTVVLWATAQAEGYPSAVWASYRQWQELGAQVRKGEQSSPVVFWKISDKDEQEDGDNGQDGEDGRRSRVFARGYSVFNAAQVDGYAVPALPALPEPERIGHAEEFFAGLGADIRHGDNRACYVPSLDQIRMPPFPVFRDAVAYYATLALTPEPRQDHAAYVASWLRVLRGDKRAIFTAAAKAQAAADWMHARQPTTAAGRAEDVAQARAA